MVVEEPVAIGAKLREIEQAMAYEIRHAYTDVQGRRFPFSRFMHQALGDLLRGGLAEDDPDLARLTERFTRYSQMDMGSRMALLRQLESWVVATQTQASKALASTALLSPGKSLPPADQTPVQYLKGVGPRMARVLNDLGVFSVQDLLYYFPRRYLDYHHRVRVIDLIEGREVTIVGTIRSVSHFSPRRNPNMTIVTITIADETGTVLVNRFFGKTHRAVIEAFKQRFAVDADVMVSGRVKWDTYKGRPSIDQAQIEILSYGGNTPASGEPASLHVGRIVPVYRLTEGLNLRGLRQAIHQALEVYLPQLPDILPQAVIDRYGLIPLAQALRHIHFPETPEHHQQAHHRLVFDELFYLQARLALTRAEFKQANTGRPLLRQAGGYVERFLQWLPFNLTAAQQRVFEECCRDLARGEPMYRLLQGDVGSGKTVVAILTLLVGVENGCQGALMVPTEILAEQHYRKLVEWLTPLGLKAGLFLGRAGAAEKRALRQNLLNGQIHIAVGTHALIQEDVAFQNLGVVVVDEQHRFGVNQRTLLKSKGDSPHMLSMTATPIPRTLALTVHGDLDVSILDERPPGRSPVITRLFSANRYQQCYDAIRQQIVSGRQAYVILPLVEESETLAIKDATSEAQRLQTEVFPEYRIGLLHGKMKSTEKDAVMQAFARGDLQILVSTTVVEVGVDVPNATVMILEHADRFGLAQLHQLRGRVGRGQHQSYCFLLTDSRSPEIIERLAFLEGTEDGFAIAEKDLEIRGPGEFLGTRQSGLPSFLLADLIRDREILEQAREAAFSLVAEPGFHANQVGFCQAVYAKTNRMVSVLGAG